ncbi:MAG: hypothetical protein PHX04_02390 [Bacilli bacterium]|nr:hypothetical protein [Bacilli bacterium]
MKYLKFKMYSGNLKDRIVYTFITFIILFIITTILSYYILPEGILKGKIPSSNILIPTSLLFSTLKIFLINFISVVFIFIGSLFAKRKNKKNKYHSVGYNVFFVLILVNAITLGTWSFGIETKAPNLINRLLGMFDIFKRAGLWEMIGQLFITCSISNIGLVLTTGKNTIIKKIKNIKLSKVEIIFIILGFVFMIIGAIIESIAILF